jgi:hypothetical protein
MPRSPNDRSADLRRRRIAAGLCPRCGAEPVPGRRQCARCLADASRRSAVSARRIRADRRARGVCYDCGRAAAECQAGNLRCEACRARLRPINRARQAHRREQAREAGQ